MCAVDCQARCIGHTCAVHTDPSTSCTCCWVLCTSPWPQAGPGSSTNLDAVQIQTVQVANDCCHESTDTHWAHLHHRFSVSSVHHCSLQCLHALWYCCCASVCRVDNRCCVGSLVLHSTHSQHLRPLTRLSVVPVVQSPVLWVD